MQKIATKIFIISSLVFGVLGILMVLIGTDENGTMDSTLASIIQNGFFISVFVILPSFALSVAGKYLMNGK